ncbi:putative nuclease HARBI1 [Pararge aegeria]|uniref:Jg17395 protein n=1 Tax=Pararge aegeria aegeria TaxID=348720 RepID=A0A8S4S5U3_9NEOP|nr:putative nuclease HARBI1 [Pararge aegeria]CAH2243292.1 jg17395 [Pararge aegeria aegeria]
MSGAYFLAAAEEDRKQRQLRVNKRVLREQGSPLDLPDEEFLKLFHLTKPLFKDLCTVLTPFLPGRQYSNAISSDIKILTALAFYGQGGYQKEVGTNLLGLSQTSVHDCLRDVTNALNSPKILRKYIKFPRTNQELEEVSRGFFQEFGIPGVAGCIDGTHVAIIRPCENEGAYFNRKNYHSINVLIICDSKLNILYVDASFGGACHDSHVWSQCPVDHFMQQLHSRGEGTYCLLGDSAYAQRPWLMTPVPRANPGSAEEYYNRLHAHARSAADRCIGVLKGRWRCMLAHKVLRYSPIKAGKMVNACVVLHNFANQAGLTVDLQEELHLDYQQQILEAVESHDMDGSRQALIGRLWGTRSACMYQMEYNRHCDGNQYFT